MARFKYYIVTFDLDADPDDYCCVETTEKLNALLKQFTTSPYLSKICVYDYASCERVQTITLNN